MKDLHPQYELLISYADGNADVEMQRQAIELINSDTEAAGFYRSLQATVLPFNEVKSASALQPSAVPQKIVDQINEAALSERPVDDDGITTTSSQTVTSFGAPTDAHAVNGERAGYGNLALAASLFCGLIAGALLYSFANGVDSVNPQDNSSAMAAAEVPEWVRLVADYHRLYVRETITASAVESADTVSKQVSDILQTSFSVPALDQHGMEFRRAQWLAIDEQPLLQLAYLPDSGKPLAVCVLKKNSAQDTAAEYGETGGMQYVHWQSDEHAVVIVGTVSPQQMQDINRVVQRELL